MNNLNDKGMDRRAALKLMAVASVGALTMGAGLVGCGQEGGGSGSSAVKGAKYYQIDKFASMSGADQLKELSDEGLGYFEGENDYYWAGVPNDNPFTGNVWINFHSVEVDDEGYDVMSRDDVTNDMAINYLEIRWDNISSPADSPEGTLQSFVEACGLGEQAGEGWTTNQYSYVGFGTCSFEDEDGYWVVEITANYDTNDAGEYTRSDNAYVRVFVGKLNGMTIEDVENSYLPPEEGTVTDDVPSADESAGSEGAEGEAVIDDGAASADATSADGTVSVETTN